MITVPKGVLKAKMLGYFREVEKTGEPLIVTDNRKPVLKIIPYQEKKSFDTLFANLQGQMKYTGQLDDPTEDLWGELT